MKAEDLRKSILQLAIQGKLVPHDPNDEPASVCTIRVFNIWEGTSNGNVDIYLKLFGELGLDESVLLLNDRT